jgi:predicted PurR-regulated permease PerM
VAIDEIPVPPALPPVRAAAAGDGGALKLRRSAWWWIRAAAIGLTVFLAYQVLVVLGTVFQNFFRVVLDLAFGGIVALVVGPFVDLLHHRGRLPRTLAILLVLLGGVALIIGAVYWAAGPAVSEARSLADQVPGLIQRANHELQALRDQLRGKGVDTSSLDLSASGNSVANRLSSLLLTTIGGTVNFVIDLVVTFVVAFWLLKDGDQLREGVLSLLPGRARVQAEFGFDAVGVVIGGYVRAQLFLALVIGTMAGVGCAIIGVPYPLVVAAAAGIFELIPIIGPFVGGAVALLLALTVSVNLALATVVLFIVIHVIEGYVLGPRIQAKFVQLHPLVALLAVFAGIDVGGFVGALFAVPLCSLAAVFIRAAVGDVRARSPELYATSRQDLYREERREEILGEFRLFKRSPVEMVKERLGRGQGPDDANAPGPPGASTPTAGRGVETGRSGDAPPP